MKKNSNLKGLIIGCGSIGERHLFNLKKMGIRNIAICDQDPKKVNDLAIKYNVTKFYDLESTLSFKPNFSFICTYPTSHIPIANFCIDANSHIFIEKPISFNLNGVEKMLQKAAKKKLQVGVGYNMRFEKGLNLLKKKLAKYEIGTPLVVSSECGYNIKLWRPGIAYKNHYILKKGGGIILDDSHEYDYLRWLLNDEVKSVFSQTMKIENIKTETESIATIILKFRKGTIASLVIDYVRPLYERKCHIVGENGDLKWEFVPKRPSWRNYDAKSHSLVTTVTKNKSVIHDKFIVKLNDMYISETQNFIHSIMENKKPIIDGWEGLKTLKIGTAALESARKNKVIFL